MQVGDENLSVVFNKDKNCLFSVFDYQMQAGWYITIQFTHGMDLGWCHVQIWAYSQKIISASEYNMAKFHYFYTVCTK